MRKYAFLLLTIILITSFSAHAQDKDYDKVLGFACGGEGSSTPVVSKTYRLLSKKKYKSIIKFLYSKNTAENFLGVILCEKLEKKKLIALTQKDLKKISELYNSNELVTVCDGCVFLENLKLSLLLENKDAQNTREDADFWLEKAL